MPAKELVQSLPPTIRRYVYSVYALVGLVLGGIQVGFSAAEAGQPVWLVVAMAVYAFVGMALGFTAAQNVAATPVTIEDGTGEHRALSLAELEKRETLRAHPEGTRGN